VIILICVSLTLDVHKSLEHWIVTMYWNPVV